MAGSVFVDTNVLIYAIELSEDLNDGQDFAGVRVVNPFRRPGNSGRNGD